MDLQVHIGWLSLLLVGLILLWAWTRSEPLRRAVFARDDPRMFGVFRIGLGLITIQNFWNLRMHWRMLWTDQGLFTAPEVRQRLGRTALKGWTELDGFLDGWAICKFFWGKYSLLYLESSPSFVTGYLVVFFAMLVLFTIGFRTRVTAVVCLMMMVSLYNRNAVYLEGHDTVFKNMWFFTVFACTGQAYSVDNWLRLRRERRYAAKLGGGRDGPIPYDWARFADRATNWLWAGLFGWWFCAIVEFPATRVTQVVLAGLIVTLIVGFVERSHREGQAERGELELEAPTRFRLIPAWPRYLFIFQLAVIYTATGLYKTGPVWRNGDALYYALNMDHFYRFEVVTQWASYYFGTNVFRVMSLITWVWEKTFALVLIGLILRFREVHRDSQWFKDHEAVKWRKWLGGLSLVAGYGVMYRIAALAYPWCLALQKDKTPTPAGAGLENLAIIMLGVIPALIIAWHLLGRWPLPIGRVFAKLLRGRFAEAKIDQPFVRKWVFGRRIWISVGFIFHFLLLTTMNIGMFPVIMIWMYPTYFEAKPFLVAGRWSAKQLRKRKSTAWMAPQSLDAALSEDAELLETPEAAVRRDPTGPWFLDPHKLFVGAFTWLKAPKPTSLVDAAARGRDRGGRLPEGLVLGLLAVGIILASMRGLEAKQGSEAENDNKAEFVGVSPKARKAATSERQEQAKARRERIEQLGDFGHWWIYAGIGLAALCHFRRRPACDLLEQEAPESEPESEPEPTAARALARPPLIGGTLMRTIALGFLVYHSSAVACLFIPRYSVTKAWRAETQKVYGDWIRAMNQSQSWKMFAPNPPRRNTFMRTIIVDEDGESYQVGNDHYTNRPYVFWYNDRERKMQRRMVGKSKWYLKYWSAYQCRTWALANDGQLPEKIETLKMRTPIPSPDDLVKSGKASDPRKRRLKKELLETHNCKPSNVSPELKQRLGWPLDEGELATLEREAKKTAKAAEVTRTNWAKRQDWGGAEPEPKADKPAVRTTATVAPQGRVK